MLTARKRAEGALIGRTFAKGLSLEKAGANCLIKTPDGKKYLAKWTARSSRTDSPQISIAQDAIDKLPSSEQADKALLYVWIEETEDGGEVFYAVALTLEQHEYLVREKISAAGEGDSFLFSKSKARAREEDTGLYLRRSQNPEQWEQFTKLALSRDILFAVEVPAPVVYVGA